MKTELENKEIQRLSNSEANKITKDCLQIALMKLMSEKDFDEISISEITKKAGVSRTAFYRNYNSKEEIIEDACHELSERLKESFQQYRNNWKGWYHHFFQIVKDNKETFKFALQANVQIGPTDFLNLAFPPKNKDEYYTQIAKEAAFYQIVSSWLDSGMLESTKHMANLCEKIL